MSCGIARDTFIRGAVHATCRKIPNYSITSNRSSELTMPRHLCELNTHEEWFNLCQNVQVTKNHGSAHNIPLPSHKEITHDKIRKSTLIHGNAATCAAIHWRDWSKMKGFLLAVQSAFLENSRTIPVREAEYSWEYSVFKVKIHLITEQSQSHTVFWAFTKSAR